jgi:hypothetical protein
MKWQFFLRNSRALIWIKAKWITDIGIPLTTLVSPDKYRVFHFEVSISASRLDLGSKSQHILTLARARSISDFQTLGAKAKVMRVDFSDC